MLDIIRILFRLKKQYKSICYNFVVEWAGFGESGLVDLLQPEESVKRVIPFHRLD